MIKVLKSIFTSPDSLKTVAAGIDKAWLTPEEQQDYFLKYLEATLPMNKSRRWIAISITFAWLAVLCVVVLLTIIGGVSGYQPALDTAATSYTLLQNVLSPIFGLVVAFYFGSRFGQKN